jgi:hypothetical protein
LSFYQRIKPTFLFIPLVILPSNALSTVTTTPPPNQKLMITEGGERGLFRFLLFDFAVVWEAVDGSEVGNLCHVSLS